MRLVSVVIPTHNPHRGRLARTLAGLAAQTLPTAQWEIILVDNASHPALAIEGLSPSALANLRLVTEPRLGLTSARRRGFAEARSELIVLVDDDNVLAPDYLATVIAHFNAHPRLGALGGRSLGEFESPRPDWWQPDFDGLIALRDLGDFAITADSLFNTTSQRDEYPVCAPIGAGMALRRAALDVWLSDAATASLPDRRGEALTSSGDNDIVLSALRSGWGVAYFPDLSLTHLIPRERLDEIYLGRLNRGIQKSWVQVLARHHVCPWVPISAWTVPLRAMRLWFRHRTWRGPAERIFYAGLLGRLEGQALLSSPLEHS